MNNLLIRRGIPLLSAFLAAILRNHAQATPDKTGPAQPHLNLVAPAKMDPTPRGFIPNLGQLSNEAVRFTLRDGGVTTHFTETGFVLHNGQTTTVVSDGVGRKVPVAPRWQVVGARPVKPVGGKTFDHTVSYFRGNDPAKWQSKVPAYRDLRYPEILAGTEMRIESRERGFEYAFHIQPQARPELRFRYDGVTGLEKSATGDLVVRTATGHYTESRPVAFQWIDGSRREVASSFEVVSASEYRINVGTYDPRHELIVDPVLDWSTSVGGSYQDQINVIKVDPDGNIVVAGPSFSVDLPTTSGFAPFGTGAGENFGNDPQLPEHADVYIAKFSADGTQLLWAGYLGGEGPHPESTGRNKPLVIDDAGDIYITTHTQSPDFPVLPVGNSIHQGGTDGAITKITADGSAIVWSRLLGGPGEDHGYAVAIHGNELYLSGVTTSPNFPVTARTFAGMQDAFIAKLNRADGMVAWSSFLGGSQEERISALVADATGVIVFGDTDSADFHAPDFPVPAGHDRVLGGSNDAFLTKLDRFGAIVWSTYLGGSQAETSALGAINGFTLTWGLSDMALDSAGNIVAAGHTYSSDFPAAAGRFQPTLVGTMDGYVAKLAPDGSQVLWSTYLGGSGPHDRIVGVVLNSRDQILVCGGTSSLDFPTTTDAVKPVMAADGLSDGFLAKFDENGQRLLYSTYIGNNGWNDAALALGYGFGRVIVGGWHFDTFFNITQGAFLQDCANCGSETFLMSFLDAFLAHDGFESGTFSGGSGWAGPWTTAGDFAIRTNQDGPHAGARHVRLRGGTGYLQRTVNVPPGTTTLRLGFWGKVNSFESTDQAHVLVRKDSATFGPPLRTFTAADSDSTYRYHEIDLTGFIPATQIHIGFDAAMSSTRDDNWFLDDIRITGTYTPPPPPANPLHVGNLVGSSGPSGRKNWTASVTVTMRDGNNAPVPGATVNVQWTGGVMASAVTDANGQCSFTRTLSNSTASTTLEVKSATHATLTYNAAENQATSITVNKPL